MNIRFDDSILQDFGDLCSTFFSSTPMFSIEPIVYTKTDRCYPPVRSFLQLEFFVRFVPYYIELSEYAIETPVPKAPAKGIC